MGTGLGSSFIPAATQSTANEAGAVPSEIFETPSLQHLNGAEPVAGIVVIPVLRIAGIKDNKTIANLFIYAPAAMNQKQLEGTGTGNLHTVRGAQELADKLNNKSYEDALRSGAETWSAQETKQATAYVSFTVGVPANYSAPSR